MTSPRAIGNRVGTSCLLFLLLADSAVAFDYEQVNGPASLKVHAEGKQLALSGALEVTITVEGPGPLHVDPVKPAGTNWDVLVTSTETEAVAAERVRWRETLTLAPTRPDALPLELPPMHVRDGTGERTIAFKPVTIPVATQIKEISPRAARDITATEEPPELPAATTAWVWFALVPAAIALLTGLWFVLGRRGRAQPASALRKALRECDRLVALRLPERDHGKSFVILLTGIARRYLERRFDLPARRRTTAELLGDLDARSDLGDGTRRWLHEFFTQTDLVKFAGAAIGAERCQALVDEVRHFCRTTSVAPPAK